jgi:hypothetical protein
MHPELGPNEVLTIGDAVACDECAIRLDVVATLGGGNDPSSFRENAAGVGCMVARNEEGSFLVSGMLEPGTIYRYHADGSLVERLGGQGQGPGEFGSQLRVWVTRGDTILVHDDTLRRMTFLGPDGTYLHSFPSPGRDGFARVGSGEFVFFTRAMTSSDPLFARVSSEGQVVRQFGRSEHPEPDIDTHLIFPSLSGGYWTASVWRYELLRRDATDAPQMMIQRAAPWFPPDGEFSDDVYVTQPPPPFLSHLWEAPDGLLWTYTLVPDPTWEPGLGMRPSPEWYRRTFDTVIEVLDLENEVVVGRTRYDGRLGQLCGSHLMYTVIELPSGDTRIQVLEPHLNGSVR